MHFGDDAVRERPNRRSAEKIEGSSDEDLAEVDPAHYTRHVQPLIYSELVPFYHLLDPLEDHRDEEEAFGALLRRAAPGGKLLELGSGAGHGAFFIKKRFDQVTLADLSEPMLGRSRTINPECEHLVADMRGFRGDSPVDAVLIHDAISHIATRQDLSATAKTVAANLRPKGAALLIPDCTKESYREAHEDHAGDDDERSMRCMYWSHDPDPSDDTHLGEFGFLLREGGEVRAVHDRHVYGLFSRETWLQTLSGAGLLVEEVERWLPPEYVDLGYTDRMYLCRMP